ncbi:MAG TPA: DUF4920 domain-containing protein [Saprospiraceae bacterium]|nr:DUF4920 domain-containing protein [Saprospiraceae bacterium]
MKKIMFLTLMGVVLGLMACQSTPKGDGKTFGTGVSNPSAAVAFADVVRQLDSVESINVVMKGKVTGVCQEKGCWMKIVAPDSSSAEELFVQFKDYGFFMPKDLAGHQVLLEGKAYKAETSVKQLRHYAEDAKKSEEEIAQITEPLVEKKFMASGVVILD